jgi:hypothetical protein
MHRKRSRLRTTVAVVRLEVAGDQAIAAANRQCSDRTWEARVPPPLPRENVLDLRSAKSVPAPLRCPRTLDTGAIQTTISGGWVYKRCLGPNDS